MSSRRASLSSRTAFVERRVHQPCAIKPIQICKMTNPKTGNKKRVTERDGGQAEGRERNRNREALARWRKERTSWDPGWE